MNPRLIPSIVALMIATSSPALAQRELGKPRFGHPTSTARAYQDYLYGEIKKIDKTELVLDKTKFGVDQTVKLGPKTKFIKDGKASRLDNFKIGEGVFVETKKDKKTGEMIAKKVLAGMGATQPQP
jgi:hypothetical protein